jgi:DNA-binding cell septation regulator SpoVG
MFNYEVRVRSVNAGKMKAVATLVVDSLLEVEGFKIYEGSKGLFVSLPSHKGMGKDEQGNQIEKYYDDVRAVGEQGEALIEEIKEEILKQYESSSRQQSTPPANANQNRANVAAAQVVAKKQQAAEPVATPQPKANKKPLW